jgi:hypothetical protein
LKSKRRAKWRHEFAQYYGKSWTREIGAELLLQSWTELSNSVVAASWDYNEEISDDEVSVVLDTDPRLRPHAELVAADRKSARGHAERRADRAYSPCPL